MKDYFLEVRLMTLIECDRKRWGGETQYAQIRLLRYKRLCEKYANNHIIYPVVWVLYHRLQVKFGTDIPAKTKIGAGFKIEHLNGIVINPNVVIGKNCNIYNGVTIGKEKRGTRIGCPQIGDKVWMGANAVIVGHIIIGNDVLIAPGAYINFDVPSHSIVLGNPAKIIHRENATEEYITNTI